MAAGPGPNPPPSSEAVLRVEGRRVPRFWEHEDPDAICAALGARGRGR